MKVSEDKQNVVINIPIEDLLDNIPNGQIISYAEDVLDMIHVDDADKHCDCEASSIDDLGDYELKDVLNGRGYIVLSANSHFGENSIIRNSNLKRLFEFLSAKTDSELIKIVDGIVPEEK